ncbi:MAG: protein translocase subunit SecD [Treponemataceae bacterium]
MNKRLRFVVVLVVLASCFGFLWPSISWYRLTSKEMQNLALSSLEKIKDYAVVMADKDVKELIQMARTDKEAPLPESYNYLLKTAKQNLKDLKKTVPKEWTIADFLQAFPFQSELLLDIEKHYRDTILNAKKNYNSSVKLGLDLSGGMSVIIKADLQAALASQVDEIPSDNVAQFREEAMAQTIDTLRGRIDRFGLTEPLLRRQGEDRIYIEIPGAAETDRINSIIMGKGILNFRLVDDEATTAFKEYYRSNQANTFDATGKLLNPSIIPDDVEILGLYIKDEYGLDERIDFLAVKKEVALEGKHIKSAEVGSDNISGRPQVNFILDAEGAEIFAAFTTQNKDKRLAIVSDDKIKSAASINEPITGGQVAISGFGREEAQTLQKVLQTAWLNVPLSIESQQVIGASLGKIAIDEGIQAIFYGLIAVMVFMLLWYKGAGFNAIVAQILNLFMMFSILSAFGLTLTLPSIAGMILTIGMAVDANVVIFERIRDEIRLGKRRATAISAGFDRAFWAIMDSNITTFIAAIFLSQLGSGPIQGFAVSLSIGVISSVFTALFVSRLLFDFGTQTLKREKISIGWGLSQ